MLGGLSGSDNESLEGLQQELEDCKNDQVLIYSTILALISSLPRPFQKLEGFLPSCYVLVFLKQLAGCNISEQEQYATLSSLDYFCCFNYFFACLQEVANILANGIKMRDYTKGVENSIRQVELDSIQVIASATPQYGCSSQIC